MFKFSNKSIELQEQLKSFMDKYIYPNENNIENEINSGDINKLNEIKELISLPGETDVTLNIKNHNIAHQFKLTKKRKIDQKIISKLKNVGVSLKIH